MKQIIYMILYQPLYNALMFLVWLIPGHSIGWAIIGLTILIRLALLPSSNKALKAQRRMQDLQPAIDKLRQQHKGDQQAQAKALMDLYRENKVSPVGSCLPLLVQLPIIWVLYQVFQIGMDKSRFDMLYSFIPRPSTIATHFFGLDLTQPERWILPILVGLLQFWQMRQVQSLTNLPGTAGDAKGDMVKNMNRQMMYLMPLMTVFIAMKLPAALPLYWVATTVFSIIQQWWFFRHSNKELAAPAVPVVKGAEKVAKIKRTIAQGLPKLPRWPKLGKGDVTVTVRRKGE